MKIELDYPFREDYVAGYIITNKEPRQLVLLVRKDKTKTSLSYARYLMSCKLERYLNSDEHVDHIDGNKLNDVIENLQILTPLENNRKRTVETQKEAKYKTFICPICNKEFIRPLHNYTYRPNYIPTCSRRCGGKKSHMNL